MKKRTISVSVLKKDIINGKPAVGDTCMVALALKRKGYRNIDVQPTWVSLSTLSGRYYFTGEFPSHVTELIREFDSNTFAELTRERRTTVIAPFRFKLKITRDTHRGSQ